MYFIALLFKSLKMALLSTYKFIARTTAMHAFLIIPSIMEYLPVDNESKITTSTNPDILRNLLLVLLNESHPLKRATERNEPIAIPWNWVTATMIIFR